MGNDTGFGDKGVATDEGKRPAVFGGEEGYGSSGDGKDVGSGNEIFDKLLEQIKTKVQARPGKSQAGWLQAIWPWQMG